MKVAAMPVGQSWMGTLAFEHETAAAIQNPTGAITVYRRHNKPALGPVGDSLDDLQ
jgi:hypothetical protein